MQKRKNELFHPLHSLIKILKQQEIKLGLKCNPESRIISLTGNTITCRFIEAMQKLGICNIGNAVRIIRKSCATIFLEKTKDLKLIK